MADLTAPRYSATFRNTPVFLLGLLANLFAAAGAGYAAVTLLPASELLWPAVEISAVSIAVTIALSVAVRSHREWHAGENGLHVRETPALSIGGRKTEVVVPYSDFVALRRVDSGLDALLELETVSGVRYRLMQGFARNASGILLPDAEGFHLFSNALRAKIGTSTSGAVSFTDGLGFWNKPFGLGILVALLILTLGLSGLILFGVFSGLDMPQGAAMQGLAFVLLLPFGVGYALYQSWARRQFVLGLSALREKLTQER